MNHIFSESLSSGDDNDQDKDRYKVLQEAGGSRILNMANFFLHFFISKTFHQIFSAKIFHRKLSTQNVPPKLPTSIIMNSHSLVSLVHLPSFPQEYLSFVMWVFFEIWRKILHLDWCFPYFKDKEPNNLKAKTLSEEWNGFFHSRYLFST